jgi:serine/threonine protein kinase
MVKHIGQYTLFDELGKGGFGVVYYAKDSQENSLAVKSIEISGMKEQQRHRIDEEIKCMLKFKHRLVVRLHKVLYSEHNIYLVMEFVPGGDLQNLLERGVVMGEQTGKRLIAQIVEALKLLHENRVIHRDVKPANVLLTSTDLSRADIKIMDFGLSRNLLSSSLMTHSVVGTPAFTAPEILRKERYSFKADVWSLGALCFELLIGRQAFKFRTLRELKEKQRLPLNIPFDCRISDSAKDFLKLMLTYDPNLRPTVVELQTHPFLSTSSPIDSPPEPMVVEAPPKAPRKKQSYSEAIMMLEQWYSEADDTRALAVEYEHKAELVIALFLYELYENLQQMSSHRAESLHSSIDDEDRLYFDLLYGHIQDELAFAKRAVESLRRQLAYTTVTRGSVVIFQDEVGQELQGQVLIAEARRVLLNSLNCGSEEDCRKALMILNALCLSRPDDSEAADLLEEVRVKYFSG